MGIWVVQSEDDVVREAENLWRSVAEGAKSSQASSPSLKAM